MAGAGSVIAAPTESYYSLQASAPSKNIDGVVINASAG